VFRKQRERREKKRLEKQQELKLAGPYTGAIVHPHVETIPYDKDRVTFTNETTITGIEPICQLCWYVRVYWPRLAGKYISAEMRRSGATLPRYYCKSSKSERCNKRVDFEKPCEHFAYNPFNQFERHSKDGRLRTREELERLFQTRR